MSVMFRFSRPKPNFIIYIQKYKTDQSSYQNIKQNMQLVCRLWLNTILGFMIQVGSLEKKITYLYAEEEVKQVFTPAPFVPIQSGFSLRKHLVRAKVYPLLREKGSSCCGKSRCETCFNIKETNTFQSFVTKKVYKINHHFHCDSMCIVYLLYCEVYGLQYVG